MSELTKAVALTGIIDTSFLQELCKWRLPVDLPEGEPYSSPEEAVAAIEAALESKDQVEVRMTDLSVLTQYLKTQHAVQVHIVTTNEKGTWTVQAGTTSLGEYIIPWKTDSLTDFWTNGESYIKDDGEKHFPVEVRDCFFGEQKAFIICRTVKRKS